MGMAETSGNMAMGETSGMMGMGETSGNIHLVDILDLQC